MSDPQISEIVTEESTQNAQDVPADKPRGLFSLSFLGLLITQFTVSLNDNIFRWLIVPIGSATLGAYFLRADLASVTDQAVLKAAFEKGQDWTLSLGAILFLLPFVLLSGYGGICADRFSKRSVMIWCKVAEIVIMISGVTFIYMGNLWLLLISLFAMGCQSAFYSPSKYSSIPEIVSEENVARANGIIGLTTMLACIFGAVIGMGLYGLTTLPGAYQKFMTAAPGQHNLWISASVLIGVAVTGLLSSLLIQRLPARDPGKAFPANPVGQSFRDVAFLWSSGALFLAAVGSAFYWGLANLAQINIQKFAVPEIVPSQDYVSPLMALMTLGIAVGCFVAGFLTKHGRVNLRYIPEMGLGIAFLAVMLFLTPQGTGEVPSTAYTYAAMVLFGLGIFAGIYDILLMTFLQQEGEQKHRGQIIGGSNFLSFTAMLLASGLFALFTITLKFSARDIWLMAGLATIGVAIISLVFVRLKESSYILVMGFLKLFYRFEFHGMENLPKDRGAALLIGNHVSFLDGLILLLMPDLGNHPETEENRPTKEEPVLDENGMVPLEKMRGRRLPRIIFWAAYLKPALLNKLAKIYRGIPVQPGKMALRAIREANRCLKNGEVVGIFPEGGITRNGTIWPFQSGVMHMLKDIPETPIIPFHIGGLWGSIFSFKHDKFFWKWPERLLWRNIKNLQFRRHVVVTFGKPFYAPKDRYELRLPVKELEREYVEKNVMVEGKNSDNFHQDQIPIRGFVKWTRKRGKKLQLADSTGTELSGYKTLIGAIAMKRLFRREVYGKDPTEQNIGLLVPPSVPGALANAAITLDLKTVVNLNYTVSSDIMNLCIRTADIKHVITSRRVMEKMNFNLECEVVYLEDLRKKITTWDKIVAAFMTFCLPLWLLYRVLGLHNMNADDTMTLVFTSGSTGIPKGVMLTHKNIGGNICSYSDFLHINSKDSALGVMPFFHSFGYTTILWTVLARGLGGYYHYSPLEVRPIIALCQKYRPTIFAGTPTFLRMYARQMKPEDLASLQIPVTGGERCPKSLMDEYRNRFGVRLIQGYGITECSPVIAANIPELRHFSELEPGQKDASIGFPLPGVSVKILNLDTGKECGVNETGMLWVSGILVMKGYYGDPEKTAEVIKDGWYCTGDLVYTDEDGFMYIAGRLSRFSKIGGEMVPHEGLEEKLNEVLGNSPDEEPKICVTSVMDEKKGEKLIVLYTTLNDKTPEEINRLLLDRGFPPLWIPGLDAYYPIDHLPLLGTGKLDLYGMKQTAERLVAAK